MANYYRGIIAFGIAFLLLVFMHPASSAGEDNKQISIGLTLKEQKKVVIALEDGQRVINEASGASLEITGGSYSFSWSGSGIKVEGPSGNVDVFGGPLLLSENSSYHKVEGTQQGNLYRGKLKIKSGSQGLLLTNILDLEEYLYGVLPREMPASWGSLGGMEALKAQAVAARTYALSSMGRHGEFDLCDTVHCQVYGGVGSKSAIREHDNTNRAVDATRGEVLTYQGKLITPLYHATNGGYTELPQNVWNPNASYPYLQSKEDPYDDPTNPLNISNFIIHNRARWKTIFSAFELEESLNDNGLDVGSISQIEVKRRFPSKRVKELVVTGSKGQESLFRENARTAFALNSQMFYVEEKQGDELWLMSVEDEPRSASSESIYATSSTKNELINNNVYAVSSSAMEKVPQPAFLFTGWGWGHGIGMSQNGAYNRSRSGQSYDEILIFYYNGAKLTNNYNR